MCIQTKDDVSTKVALGFGDVTATIGDHIAHFYRTRDQKFDVLGPYIAEGIRGGDRCLLHCSPEDGKQLCEWLTSKSIDADGAVSSQQLIMDAGEATGDAQMTLAAGIEAKTLKAGYKFVRSSGDWGWALAGGTSIREMLRWEALLDNAMEDSKIIALCQFDLTQFGANDLLEALRTHPLCIMGQILVPNPFHESSDVILEDL